MDDKEIEEKRKLDVKIVELYMGMRSFVEEEKGIDLTGKKVGLIYSLVETLISEDELEEFHDYIGQEEAVGPMLDPTAYKGGVRFKQLDQAKERVLVLEKMLELLKKKEDI